MTQKIITVGNSIGVVFPKPLVRQLGFAPGQSINVNVEGPDRVVIERKRVRTSNKRTELLRWAAEYVEKYRKDFEALADK